MMGAAFLVVGFSISISELDLNLEVFRIRVIQGRKENSRNMEVDLLQLETMH